MLTNPIILWTVLKKFFLVLVGMWIVFGLSVVSYIMGGLPQWPVRNEPVFLYAEEVNI